MGAPATFVAEQARLLAGLIGPERDDADIVARRLLSAFGSLSGVLQASAGAIGRVVGEQRIAQLIGAARETVLASQREQVRRALFDLHDERLQRYIVGLFRALDTERLHAIYLDSTHCYLRDEPVSDGSCGQVTGNLRGLVRRALDVGAFGIVLAHNHPSGVVTPSRTDIAATRRIAGSLADLDLVLVDHLIVAGTKIHSMRGAGWL